VGASVGTKCNKSARAGRTAKAVAEEQPSPQSESTVVIERSLVYIVYPALLLLAISFCCFRPLLDPDCWFHMAFGRLVLQTHSLPRQDVFSFTVAGNEWISSGWLSSVVLYMSYHRWSFSGLALMVFAVVAVTYIAIYYHGIVRLHNRGSLAVVLLVSVLAANLRFTPRPELFSQLFLSLLLLALLHFDEHLHSPQLQRAAYMFPAIICAWANFHAGFIIGMVVLAVYVARPLLVRAEPIKGIGRISIAVMCLGLITWLFNPYGWHAMRLGGKIESMPRVQRHVMEWMPLLGAAPSLPSPTLCGLLILVLIVLFIMWLNCRCIKSWHIALLCLFMALPLWQRRHHGLSALALPVLVMPYMARFDALLRRIPGSLGGLTILLTATIGAMQHTGTLQVGRGLYNLSPDTELIPSLAVKWMKANRPPQNVYNAYGAGGYLLYHLAPETKVFIDGRLDVYDARTWTDSLAFESGELSINEFAQRYSINSALVYIRGMGTDPTHIARRLAIEPGWKLVYFDDSYALFVREAGNTFHYLRQNAYRFINPFALDRLSSPEAQASRQLVEAELHRALQTSENSAKASLIAAYDARIRGDEAAAQRYIEQARLKNPMVSLGVQ
jgi:hypothetical protein